MTTERVGLQLLFLALLIVQMICAGLSQNVSYNVVQGQDARPGQYPYQISLQYLDETGQYSHFCGASIITNNFVLSDNHFKRKPGKPADGSQIQAVAGETDLSTVEPSEQRLDVLDIIIHDNYSDFSLENDVALVYLDGSFTMNDYVQPITMPNFQQQTTGKGTITGWGATSKGGASSAILQETTANIISDSDCATVYGVGRIVPPMICFDGEGTGPCQGDSGSPMVSSVDGTSYYQSGIVSWGLGCGAQQYPAVLTEVSYYTDWIQEKMTLYLQMQRKKLRV